MAKNEQKPFSTYFGYPFPHQIELYRPDQKRKSDFFLSRLFKSIMHSDAFSDINRQPFFGEDPSHYVDEVKQSLATERGLNPRNRELVMEVLGRLAERVQSAEHSRNAVVNELVSLRERFQVRETPEIERGFEI